MIYQARLRKFVVTELVGRSNKKLPWTRWDAEFFFIVTDQNDQMISTIFAMKSQRSNKIRIISKVQLEKLKNSKPKCIDIFFLLF